jgi:protein arginine N-methyltransferase 1
MGRLPGHHAPIDYHRALIDDSVRLSAWDRAIRALVRPGMRVLDAGAGTGVLGMLAAKRGAHVIAVESADVAELAGRLIRSNGLEDRIELRHGDIAALAPEPVDLVLADCIGRFLPDRALADLVTAAASWLVPDGRFVPRRVFLRVAPVADVRMPEIDAFRTPLLGLDLRDALPLTLDTAYRTQLPPQGLLADPVEVLAFDLPAVPDPLDIRARFAIDRSAVLRGFAGWFVAQLAEGVVLDTGPGTVTFWGQTVWPAPPTRVEPGDAVALRLEGRPEVDEVWFRWEGELERDGNTLATWSGTSRPRLPEASAASEVPAGRDEVIEANHAGAEAAQAGRFDEAAEHLAHATRALDPSMDGLAPVIYENLGLALYNAGRTEAALHAFLRALDGIPTSREQAARMVVGCLAILGRQAEFEHALARYQAAFGPHPFARPAASARLD